MASSAIGNAGHGPHGRARVAALCWAVIATSVVGQAPVAGQTAQARPGLAAPSDGALEPHRCARATERCDGEIRVPLDWSDPRSERITVAFAWVPRADTTRPATGTILANFGGPSAALSAVPRIQQVLGPVLDRKNLLVVDPRGLGRSSPLLCPGLSMSDDDAIASCAEALGPRVQYFTTDQVVADMDAVRGALGVPRVSFYGNSYGTVFAHAFATRFPERTAAVYFDSMVEIDEEGYVRHPTRRSTDVVELVCARSPACDALPGTPTATLERLIAELRSDPDPDVPIGALPMLLQGANPVGVRELPAAAVAYLAGDAAPLRRLTSLYEPNEAFEFTAAELAGTLAILCGDARSPYDRDAPPEERRRQLDRFYVDERPLSPFEVGDIRGYREQPEQCLHWPTPRASPPLPPDADYPRIPVLAASGDFDTRRPAEVAEMLERFPRSTLLHVRYGGHALAAGRSDHSECVREVVRAYLEDPRHPAPTPAEPDGCHAENFRAVGSFPLTMAQVPAAESGDLDEPDRRLVAAAFATAADAVARRNPNDAFGPLRPEAQNGLRGGDVRWDSGTGAIALERVRFVEDVSVTGTVRLDPEHHATAELAIVEPDGRARELVLRWRAFVAENGTAVAGAIDGSEFTARVPLH